MKVKTSELQNVVTRVSKGASNNKLIPLTSLVELKVFDKTLCLTTSDSKNYFTVLLENVEGEDFSALSVNVDTFTKLVQKTTSEYITIEPMSDYLMFIGNGKYKIDLLLDEEGNTVSFPEPEIGEKAEEGQLLTADVKKIIANNKASLSVAADDVPVLMNYYCAEDVISTDRYNICQTRQGVFDIPQLISAHVMELLSLFSSESINYTIGVDGILFDSASEFLIAPIVPDIELMPVDAVRGFIELSDEEQHCKVKKSQLLAVLDRLALFVSPYDKNVIYLTFGADGLRVESKKSSGAELIEYTSEFNGVSYTCAVDIEGLRSQVNSITADEVELVYGSEAALKFVTADTTRVVALQEDDR